MNQATPEPRVRGVLVLQQLAALRRLGGPAYADAIARLPPYARTELEGLGLLSWCRQSTVRGATLEVARELGIDPVRLAGDIVEESVTSTFRGVWSIFLKLTDDASLVRRAGTIFEKSFDRGTFDAELVEPGRARLTLRGWPAPHDMDLESISRSIRAALVVAGRKPPRVTVLRSPDRIEFVVDLAS